MNQNPEHEQFLFRFAYLWSVSSILYVFAVTFCNVPASNQRTVDTTIGFLLGTIIAGLIGYFYGSSHKSQAKDDTLADVIEAGIEKDRNVAP